MCGRSRRSCEHGRAESSIPGDYSCGHRDSGVFPGGDVCVGFVGPAGSFFASHRIASLAREPPAGLMRANASAVRSCVDLPAKRLAGELRCACCTTGKTAHPFALLPTASASASLPDFLLRPPCSALPRHILPLLLSAILLLYRQPAARLALPHRRNGGPSSLFFPASHAAPKHPSVQHPRPWLGRSLAASSCLYTRRPPHTDRRLRSCTLLNNPITAPRRPRTAAASPASSCCLSVLSRLFARSH